MMREFRTSAGIFEAGPDDILGKGTYGTVYRVRLRNDPTVKKAIKTFVAETMDENEGVPSTTLREVNAVKSVNHPNVMSVQEVVIPTNASVTEMFVVMELCRGTLKEKIQDMVVRHLHGDPKWVKPEPGMRLPPEYVQEAKLVAWQILNAVAVCHSRGIMHRDLKPANILWSSEDLLKIGDFGLARFVRGNPITEDHMVPQTGEVQTMWYRAPEVLLGDERYGMLVDDWSLGCVIAELFRFRVSQSQKRVEPDPLFTGRGDIHTLLLIFEALGTPTQDPYLRSLPFWSDCFPKWNPGPLRNKVALMDDVGFDLLMQLLHPSPTHRKATRFLLNHKWFNDIKHIINQRYIPWYRGCEQDYLRLLEIDRLPAARPLPAAQHGLEAGTGHSASGTVHNGGASGTGSSGHSASTTATATQISRLGSTSSQQTGGARKKRERSTSARQRDQENRSQQITANTRTTSNATKRNPSASSRAKQTMYSQAKISVLKGTRSDSMNKEEN